MATIDIGKIKPVFKGTYDNSTAYVLDDIVYYNGSSYVAKTSTTGNLPTDATKWNILASGSGGIYDSTLSIGTAGQVLKVNSGATALEFGTVSAGEYSVHKVDTYSHSTQVTGSGQNNYVDIAQGNYLSFTPTSTNDYVHFLGSCTSYDANSASGGAVYTMLGTSTSITSSDTKIGYTGTHSNYCGSTSDFYRVLQHNVVYKCTSLTPNTTYYVEMAGATHNTNNSTLFGHDVNGSGTDGRNRYQLIHYKKN